MGSPISNAIREISESKKNVESLLKKAYEEGKCTSEIYNIGKRRTMIKDKYTIDIDGKEVWLETVKINGKLTIGDGGVNIK